MTEVDTRYFADWAGHTLYHTSGEKIGRVEELWTDDDQGRPTWLTVRSLFGGRDSLVPVLGVRPRDDGDLETAYSKDLIKDAPHVEPNPTAEGRHIDESEEERLYRHYQVPPQMARQEETTGRDVSGPTTDDAMTRSEERLRVGTEQRERGRARLRKYVVTETEQVEVPVSREEVRLEREPITDANRHQAMDGPVISEEEHEVVLREERPVVDTEAVPVERVRLAKEQVQDTETVAGEVRKERIESDGTERGPRG
ncbi:hypothetical protein GCM10017786_11220 [Amycolatopsis deserti]|uniref:DUF2382 domain-containing protein n=1 Tax=Amycolatopsis deserti TaxID=185696 RepID=A0ABQ3IHU6_9PSEU|nr:PRC and DUF2382 domain-containing protein [Amycolatopsis deserti]GHE82205.1 hypothetical protein GCM10017786_11220 [Amycolatopsis deserti]